MLSSVCAFIFRSVIAYTRVFYLNSVYVSLALTLKSIFFSMPLYSLNLPRLAFQGYVMCMESPMIRSTYLNVTSIDT